MSVTTLTTRIGEPDLECRYPVVIGENQVIGYAFRWHRDWLVQDSTGEFNLGRPPKGTKGIDMAAARLAAEYAAGRISATPLAEAATELHAICGPAPLLHPRMPKTPGNVEAANAALEVLAEHRWMALSGFPGSDNPWVLRCELCGWTGPKYWSHLRPQRGLPSTRRHDGGCVGDEKVRALITAYQK
ncbi:hypothetical protein AB0C77_31605 [Streptomyces sp. NPDC048629]|uniref:hypothetical protein n=1 Tax=Streptomyces sp. NPDC048629 TaxID=3154824 RepID=UPI0034173C05